MLYFFLIFGIAIITRVMTSLAQRCTRDWIKHFDGREDSTERDIIDRITRLKRDYIDRYKRRVLFGISALWVTVTMLSLFRKNLDRLEVNVYYLMILSIFIFVFSIKSIRKNESYNEFNQDDYFVKGTKSVWRVLLAQIILIYAVFLIGSLFSSSYFYALGERYSSTIKEISSTHQIKREDWMIDFYRADEVYVDQRQPTGYSYRLDRRVGRLLAAQSLLSHPQDEMKLVLTREYSDRTRYIKGEEHLVKVAKRELAGAPMLYNICMKTVRYSEITSRYMRAITTPRQPRVSLNHTSIVEWVSPEECDVKPITVLLIMYDVGSIALILIFYLFCFNQVVECQSIVLTYLELYKDRHQMS